MHDTITYESRYETPIDTREPEQLVPYYRVYWLDGRIKKKELRKDGYLMPYIVELIYYRDSGETEAEAVGTILAAYKLERFEIREREALGRFLIIRTKGYHGDGRFDGFTAIELYDEQGRKMYEKTVDAFRGEVETETIKYYYGYPGHPELEFRYDEQGILMEVRGVNSPFTSDNGHMVYAGELDLFFPGLLAENPYYADAGFSPERLPLPSRPESVAHAASAAKAFSRPAFAGEGPARKPGWFARLLDWLLH